MIRAEDLMIGNWVDAAGDYEKVMGIEKSHFYTCSFKSTWAEINPIPLTEEILLKAGFEWVEKDKCFFIEATDVEYLFFLDTDYSEDNPNCGYMGVRDFDEGGFVNFSWGIKYVHQLQNLFKALANEELKIEL